jgi:micrococcal nuclease
MRSTIWPLALVTLLTLLATAARAETFMGQVASISSGDTLKITDARSRAQFGVRIAAIQAPGRTHGFGGQAIQNLGALLSGRDVSVEARGLTREGVVVGKVLVAAPDCRTPQCPRNIDVGLEQVRAGLAWWAPQQATTWTTDERARYEQAEFQAKIHRFGLWAGRDTFPPGR